MTGSVITYAFFGAFAALGLYGLLYDWWTTRVSRLLDDAFRDWEFLQEPVTCSYALQELREYQAALDAARLISEFGDALAEIRGLPEAPA